MSETFSTDPQFVTIFAGLAGSLAGLLLLCTCAALYIRRLRFLQKKREHELEEIEMNQYYHRPIQEAAPIPLREEASSGPRPGALSFDARDGWRRDSRISVRSNNSSGITPRS